MWERVHVVSQTSDGLRAIDATDHCYSERKRESRCWTYQCHMMLMEVPHIKIFLYMRSFIDQIHDPFTVYANYSFYKDHS